MIKYKIFVSTMLKFDNRRIESPIYTNVQSGAAFDDFIGNGLVGDNTGDNISIKNRNYSELTVQYWAWKNFDLDYYGLCHYRRFLSFSKKHMKSDNYGFIVENQLNEKCIKTHKLDDEKIIEALIKRYDIIIKQPSNCRQMPVLGERKFVDNEKEFWESQNNRYVTNFSINVTKNIIKDYYPNYYDDMLSFFNGTLHFGYNLFLMNKECFNELCEFLFGVLFKVEKMIDTRYYGGYLKRIYGYLGEILFSTYIIHKKRDRSIKIKMMQAIKVINVKNYDIMPSYEKDSIAIAIVVHDYRVPNLSVIINSIIKNSDDSHNYDLIIMSKNLSTFSTSQLQTMNIKNNMSIRIVQIKDIIEQFPELKIDMVENSDYLNLLLPWIFKNYQKILWLTTNVIVNTDLFNINEIDIGDSCVAAVVNYLRQGKINLKMDDKFDYDLNVLKLKTPYDYMDSRVSLYNIPQCLAKYDLSTIIDKINNLELLGEANDLFNLLFEKNSYKLNFEWNYYFSFENNIQRELQWMPDKSVNEYNNTLIPKIINFVGIVKPWENQWSDYKGIFWKYARDTPFYETLIVRMLEAKETRKIEGK